MYPCKRWVLEQSSMDGWYKNQSMSKWWTEKSVANKGTVHESKPPPHQSDTVVVLLMLRQVWLQWTWHTAVYWWFRWIQSFTGAFCVIRYSQSSTLTCDISSLNGTVILNTWPKQPQSLWGEEVEQRCPSKSWRKLQWRSGRGSLGKIQRDCWRLWVKDFKNFSSYTVNLKS